MAFIRGLAKCKWSKRRLGGGSPCVPQRASRRLYSGGGLIRLHTYRAKRTRAKPIGIALAFLGQCDNSLCDDVFRNKPTTVAKRRHAFSNAAPIARVSSGPNTKSRTREERYP
jgi:hypothetical protein